MNKEQKYLPLPDHQLAGNLIFAFVFYKRAKIELKQNFD